MKKISTKKKNTSNRELVFAALQKGAKPLTAYELLARLRPYGISGPPTVYRALDRLIEDGMAHRLESLNAFVACAGPHHGATAIFSICHDCGTAEEITDLNLSRRIGDWARKRDFGLDRAVLELHGHCSDCGCAKQLAR